MLKIKKKFLLVVTFVIPNLFFQLDFLLIINDEYLGSPYVKEIYRIICKKLI